MTQLDPAQLFRSAKTTPYYVHVEFIHRKYMFLLFDMSSPSPQVPKTKIQIHPPPNQLVICQPKKLLEKFKLLR